MLLISKIFLPGSKVRLLDRSGSFRAIKASRFEKRFSLSVPHSGKKKFSVQTLRVLSWLFNVSIETRASMSGVSIFSTKIGFFSKTQYLGFEFFSKNVNVFFYWKECFFFLKSPRLLQKPLVFGNICILLIPNVCFQPFARLLDQLEAKSLDMRTILTKPNQGSLKFICKSFASL